MTSLSPVFSAANSTNYLFLDAVRESKLTLLPLKNSVPLCLTGSEEHHCLCVCVECNSVIFHCKLSFIIVFDFHASFVHSFSCWDFETFISEISAPFQAFDIMGPETTSLLLWTVFIGDYFSGRQWKVYIWRSVDHSQSSCLETCCWWIFQM